MAALKEKIESFCKSQGIEIPSGFARRSPSRYVVIKNEGGNWQLTAKTWFKVSDVLNYLNNYCGDADFKILDFKDDAELKRRGEKQLEKHGNLPNVA